MTFKCSLSAHNPHEPSALNMGRDQENWEHKSSSTFVSFSRRSREKAMSLSTLFQRFFFPGMKVTPPSRWREELLSIAMVEDIEVFRNGKVVAGLVLHRAEVVKGTVILCHPASKRAKYYPLAQRAALEYYLNHELRVVLFDFNGFGASERIDFFYWQDVQSVIAFCNVNFSRQPVLLHGFSFGAFHAVKALPSLGHQSSVVLENTSRCLLDYWGKFPMAAFVIRCALSMRIDSFVQMDPRSVLSDASLAFPYIHFIACELDDVSPACDIEELYDTLSQHSDCDLTMFHNCEHLEAPKQLDKYHSVLKAAIARAFN